MRRAVKRRFQAQIGARFGWDERRKGKTQREHGRYCADPLSSGPFAIVARTSARIYSETAARSTF